MTARRGATGLSGLLCVDKPADMTSHDVVAAVRRATGERRVGHAGTLDPMATGLLLVLVGSATRLERYLVGHDKVYDATIAFGATTDTLDAEGAVIETRPVPALAADEAFAAGVLARFAGAQEQMPPAYSAIKRDGLVAHRVARAGGVPVLEARPIVVHGSRLIAVDAAHATWTVRFAVSKGTYVRALARDIGEAVGVGAHLSGLRRIAVGATSVDAAIPLDDLIATIEATGLGPVLADPLPLLGLPHVVASADDVRDGRPLPLERAAGETAVVLADDDRVFGVFIARDGLLRAETLFVPGVPRR